jgi:hypothetical protein
MLKFVAVLAVLVSGVALAERPGGVRNEDPSSLAKPVTFDARPGGI